MNELQARFDAIYAEFEYGLRAYVIPRVHDEALAGDILQIVWLKVWKALPATNRITFSWLRMIAKNTMLDQWQSQKIRACLSLDDDHVYEEASDIVAPPCDEPEDTAVRQERLRAVLALLQRIPPKRRETLKLSVSGYSNEEIQQIMGTSYQTVSKHASAARHQLRQLMEASR